MLLQSIVLYTFGYTNPEFLSDNIKNHGKVTTTVKKYTASHRWIGSFCESLLQTNIMLYTKSFVNEMVVNDIRISNQQTLIILV